MFFLKVSKIYSKDTSLLVCLFFFSVLFALVICYCHCKIISAYIFS